MSNSPRLAYNDWQLLDTDTLMAWADDEWFFDIRPSQNQDTLELRINNVGDARVIYLGDSDSVGQAIVRARKFLDSQGREDSDV